MQSRRPLNTNSILLTIPHASNTRITRIQKGIEECPEAAAVDEEVGAVVYDLEEGHAAFVAGGGGGAGREGGVGGEEVGCPLRDHRS